MVVDYIGDVLVGIDAESDGMVQMEKRVAYSLVLVFAEPEHGPGDRQHRV